MGRSTIAMEKHIEILRLKYDCRLQHRRISDALGISIGTVTNVLKRARQAGIGWPIPAGTDVNGLREILYPQPQIIHCGIEVDFSSVREQLRQKGVTRELLWTELGENGYTCSYSQFCRDYKAWGERKRVTMRQQHEPGDTVFVDFGGLTVPVGDQSAQIFVAALGASHYTFAMAVWSQTVDDWMECHSSMVEFFGGCPILIVPDNLKSGVTKSCRYDPDINLQYERWAQYYGMVIMPARVRKPKDKSVAEIAVKMVQTKILAPVRKVHFDTFSELNTQIAKGLEKMNSLPFQKRQGSRIEAFERLDRPVLRPLPLFRYQNMDIKQVKVGMDYHVEYLGHWYSVPYLLLYQKLEIQSCARMVRVYNGRDLVALHPKDNNSGNLQTTDLNHMPKAHQEISKWNPQRLLKWAVSIGSDCETWVNTQLNNAAHFHKVSRLCVGVLSLHKKYGKPQLNRACRIANEQHFNRYKQIKQLLQNALNEPIDDGQLTINLPQDHKNVRGADYFK